MASSTPRLVHSFSQCRPPFKSFPTSRSSSTVPLSFSRNNPQSYNKNRRIKSPPPSALFRRDFLLLIAQQKPAEDAKAPHQGSTPPRPQISGRKVHRMQQSNGFHPFSGRRYGTRRKGHKDTKRKKLFSAITFQTTSGHVPESFCGSPKKKINVLQATPSRQLKTFFFSF